MQAVMVVQSLTPAVGTTVRLLVTGHPSTRGGGASFASARWVSFNGAHASLSAGQPLFTGHSGVLRNRPIGGGSAFIDRLGRSMGMPAVGFVCGFAGALIAARTWTPYLISLPLGAVGVAAGLALVLRQGTAIGGRLVALVGGILGGYALWVVVPHLVLASVLSLVLPPDGSNHRIPNGATAASPEAHLVFAAGGSVEKSGSQAYCSPDQFGSHKGHWISDVIGYRFQTSISHGALVEWYRVRLAPLGWTVGTRDENGAVSFIREHGTGEFDYFDVFGPDPKHGASTAFRPSPPNAGCDTSSNHGD